MTAGVSVWRLSCIFIFSHGTGESGRSCETHDHRSGAGFANHPDVLASCFRLSGEPYKHVHLTYCFAFFVSMNVTNTIPPPLQFYEGYGQTECTAGCSMSMPGDWSAGTTSTNCCYCLFWSIIACMQNLNNCFPNFFQLLNWTVMILS